MEKFYTIIIYIIFIILILIPDILFSEPWVSIYGGLYTDYVNSMQIDDNKNYIMAGAYTDCATCPGYFFLTKANTEGDSLWSKIYIHGGASDIIITNDGNYLAGGTKDISPSASDYYLVKTNINGDTIWTHSYGIYVLNYRASIRQTSDGDLICVWRYVPDEHGMFIMKTDSLGDTIWTEIIRTGYSCWGRCILVGSRGEYLIVGSTSPGGSEQNGYIVKIDSLGEVIWDTIYGDIGYTDLFYISPTEDSCYIITGFTTLYHIDYIDLYLLKINEDGDTLWTRKFGGYDYNDYGRCVKQTNDGGYIIVGYTYSYGVGTPDYSNVYLIKTDSLGNLEWEKTYGGPYEDRGHSVSQTDDGGYIIAGVYDQGPHRDVYLIKTDSLGETEWIREVPTKPQEFSLNVYPNPFNSSCKIEAPIEAKIRIFDLAGREIIELSPGQQSWQPERNVTSGVYLVKATVGERKITKKVVYLK